MKTYDIIVIWAGAGWLTVAIWWSLAGKKVCMIEKWNMWGDCTNYGCVPSKALIHMGKKSAKIKEALEYARTKRQEILDEESAELLEEKYGIKVIKWNAEFIDNSTIAVGEETISGKHIVIATGSSPRVIDIPNISPEDLLTNETIFEQKKLKNLVMIWGGYIGCELAAVFANLGVKVSLVQRNVKLIPREEEEASQLMDEILRAKGVDIYYAYTPVKAEKWKLVLEDKEWNQVKIKYDKVMIALGRAPNVDKLKLENIGVNYDKRWIVVDKYNRTSSKNIFAIGDCVAGNPQFTHWANHEGRGVLRNIFVPFWKKSVRDDNIPSCIYTDLEFARVGKTQAELEQLFGEDMIVSKILYFETNDRSKLTEDTQGFVKINFCRLNGKIFGATIVNSKAGEMLPVLTSAMNNNISAYKLSSQMFSYPTQSELIKKVADSFVASTLGNIKAELKFFLKKNVLQIITAIIWISIIVWFLYYKSICGLSNQDIAINFYNFVRNNYWWPIIYILIYAIRPIVMFPATFLTFLSGALFGVWWGFLYTMVWENLSANFAYLLGKIFGKNIIKPWSSGLLSDLKKRFEHKSFMPVLMTRLLFFPFDIVNYVSGILKVNWRWFALATLVGIIPWALVFILAGAAFYKEEITSITDAVSNVDVTMLYLAAALFIVTIVVARVLKKFDVK